MDTLYNFALAKDRIEYTNLKGTIWPKHKLKNHHNNY